MFHEQATLLPDAIEQGILPEFELFDNPLTAGKNSAIKIIFPEFTCLCPKTGYPDFASIALYYLPKKQCIELKSWKLYLNSFRMIGTFHEAVTNHLFSEIVDKLDPEWAMVVGDFFPRGNVNTTVVLETETPRPASVSALLNVSTPHTRSFE